MQTLVACQNFSLNQAYAVRELDDIVNVLMTDWLKDGGKYVAFETENHLHFKPQDLNLNILEMRISNHDIICILIKLIMQNQSKLTELRIIKGLDGKSQYAKFHV